MSEGGTMESDMRLYQCAHGNHRHASEDNAVRCGDKYGAHPEMDLRARAGRGDGGGNLAHHRRNLIDPGTCEVPKGQTITLSEWRSQQSCCPDRAESGLDS